MLIFEVCVADEGGGPVGGLIYVFGVHERPGPGT